MLAHLLTAKVCSCLRPSNQHQRSCCSTTPAAAAANTTVPGGWFRPRNAPWLRGLGQRSLAYEEGTADPIHPREVIVPRCCPHQPHPHRCSRVHEVQLDRAKGNHQPLRQTAPIASGTVAGCGGDGGRVSVAAARHVENGELREDKQHRCLLQCPGAWMIGPAGARPSREHTKVQTRKPARKNPRTSFQTPPASAAGATMRRPSIWW
jgi:hypothetical protein